MIIVEEIDREIALLQKAREIILGTTQKRGRGRPKGSVGIKLQAKVQGTRVMSAEGRARIAAAQKKRWAAKRKADRKAAATQA